MEKQAKKEKVAKLIAKAQQRQQANSIRGQVKSIIIGSYADAVISAFVVGQALQVLPSSTEDREQVASAMSTLVNLANIGVLPPQVLAGVQALDRKLSPELAKTKLWTPDGSSATVAGAAAPAAASAASSNALPGLVS